ncbi:hypothetical protein DL95DRAFT_440520 [Leptodontidium sp. 2 PMI_412]|nr:hypothetical protein DL95DRAFT_440520 [Leptodontidium sp. 2 PMI_412]
MFSMLPTLPHTYGQSNHYTPHKPSPLSSSPLRNNTPSPLSPRDTNVQTRAQEQQDAIMSSPSKPSTSPFQFSNSIFTSTNTTPESASKNTLISPPPSKRESAYSKRTTKPNPLMSGRGSGDEGRETRRKLFLKRVREGSEEKKWASRGGDEEIMRCLWVAEERRRVERQRREAMGIEGPMEEEEEDQMMNIDEVMAEEVPMSEEQELEAMLSSMSPEESHFNYGSVSSNQSGMLFGEMDTSKQISQAAPVDQQSVYGSDDDEYDQLFMDVIREESRMLSQQQPPGHIQDEDMMDMS